ncbi:MAG: CRISPR-associated endonuclease Cas2 [Planctomycetes bacterium]|nr:CRISPR-associated endonuclease Cas2 [Planctomycetota bacterium]
MTYISGFKAVWLLCMFDLPTHTKKQRKAAHKFRKELIEDGYWMLQFSVYGRPCASDDHAAVHLGRLQLNLPKEGQVRVMKITDKQYQRMLVYYGKKSKAAETIPGQLELF